jgi:Predicted acetyltransferase
MIKLMFPTIDLKDKIIDFRDEFFKSSEKVIPGDGGLDSFNSIEEWINKIEADLTTENTYKRVAATLLLGINDDDKIVGIIQLRHRLNEELLLYYGHIGYSVRPNERRKGYAKDMLKQCIELAQTKGISKLLISCDKTNIASKNTILSCCEIETLEEIEKDEEIIEKYWINI